MNGERQPGQGESQEEGQQLFEREIKKALSPAFAKTIQELLPGYLPDKPQGEYDTEETARYRKAYKIVGEMVKRGEVTTIHQEGGEEERTADGVYMSGVARPKFKLNVSGGKKSRNEETVWQGGLATDPQP